MTAKKLNELEGWALVGESGERERRNSARAEAVELA